MTDDAAPAAAVPAASPSSATKKNLSISAKNSIFAFGALRRRIATQTWTVLGLAILFTIVLPFAGSLPVFYAMTPDSRVKLLIPLQMPNMTNQAILSWATTAITEVMTMGFGDMDMRLPKQKNRFTEGGWVSYMKTFEKLQIRENFKQRQLVLTTVPSNTPVIVAQGMEKERYIWVIQMPIVMTYATNNNVMSRARAIVHLTIVRIPTDENPYGVAIKDWILM
ncbi:MAG: DotI/IcmL/TraM family protein [Alphaproteobacteria bacterium]|nr:DotI/IcmL/TraM family protein [Alphaproteobacteria bacterium]